MSILPRAIPAAALRELFDALAAAGITLGPLKPGTRVTRTVTHDGTDWTLTYLGSGAWGLRGPGHQHCTGVLPEEAAAIIAAA